LFPYDSVLTLFTSSDADVVWFELSTNPRVTDNVVRGCRFLNEPRLKLGKLLHVLDSFGYIPYLRMSILVTVVVDLISINHQLNSLISNNTPCNR
jgi:hypothetical protein